MKAVRFRLRGKSYRLDAPAVRNRLRGIEPKPADKYTVEVHGKSYPPKQVLAVALGVPLTSFTTIDASRILTKVGFSIRQGGHQGGGSLKTVSECLFEDYLQSAGLTGFEYEPRIRSSARRPDFRLDCQGKQILFEVEEFRASGEEPAAGYYALDPYRSVREKIGAAGKKFQDFEDYCSSLVLYNQEKPLVLLEPEVIYGSMFGAHGFGGTMARTHTLSSIIVLERLAVGQKRFRIEVRNLEANLGRGLSIPEHMRLVEQSRGTERDFSLTQLRVVVHENPTARHPLPRELFQGPYDERYGSNDRGEVERLFGGPRIMTLEARHRLAELRSAGAFGDGARQQRWLAEHRREYAGQWVALDGDRLLSHGPDARKVFADARASGVALPMILEVRPEDELPFGGW